MKILKVVFILSTIIITGCRRDPAVPNTPIYPNWNVFNPSNSILPSNNIWEIEVDDNDQVWLLTDRKIYLTQIHGDDWENITIPGAEESSSSFWARGLSIDNGNSVWLNLNSTTTLKYSSNDAWTIYDSDQAGMVFGHVFTLKHDHIGNVYFGTAAGLIKFDGVNWERFDLSNSGITSNEVFSVAIDVDNSVWLSALGHQIFGGQSGVNHFTGSEWVTFTTNNSGLPSNAARIDIQQNGVKWFVSGFDRVATFDDLNWTPVTIPGNGEGSVKLYIDRFDNVWFCTNYGLIKYDGNQWITYSTSNSGLPSNSVNDVAVDSEGKVWVATPNGLAVFRE